MAVTLTKDGREALALALLLLKDWKCEGKFDVDITLSILKLVDHLGVRKEYDSILCKVPPMKIVPRYPDANNASDA